jgi:hypothetical protein
MTDAEAAIRTSARRAAIAYAAMQRHFWVGDGTRLYREAYPWQGGNQYAFLWPFSRALLGTLSLAGIPAGLVTGVDCAAAVADRMAGLATYWNDLSNPPAYASYVVLPLGQGGDIYYDDNVWVGLALVEQYRLGLSRSLDRASKVFEFGRAGWDRRSDDPSPGGVFWVQQGKGEGRRNHDRGAGLNAGFARLGLLLHELTGSAAYDGDGVVEANPNAVGAVNMVGWVGKYLDSGRNGSGPFWNVIRRDGSTDTNVWSYVQGEMVGARALQYRLTGDGRYLQQAEAIARQTLETFGTFVSQPPSFNVMCFQGLLMLAGLTADAGLRTSMLRTIGDYADWVWDPANGAHDDTTDLFHFSSSGRPSRATGAPAYLQDQGAMVQLYALLAWPAEAYTRLT